MRTYLIAYDLAKTTATKHAIATELMRIGSAWARPLDATWYVQTELEGAAIEARLAGLLDTDDGLLIQPVVDEATLYNTALPLVPSAPGRRGCSRLAQPMPQMSSRFRPAGRSFRGQAAAA